MSEQQEQTQVDVPGTVQQLKSYVAHLERNVLAYGELMRGNAPIVSWTAHVEGQPVEIMTDLSDIKDETGVALLQAMANTHGAAIHEALDQVVATTNLLNSVLRPPARLAPQPQANIMPPAEQVQTTQVPEQQPAAPAAPAAPVVPHIPPIASAQFIPPQGAPGGA